MPVQGQSHRNLAQEILLRLTSKQRPPQKQPLPSELLAPYLRNFPTRLSVLPVVGHMHVICLYGLQLQLHLFQQEST